MFGKCRLCLQQGELQYSHLLPKALYRLVGSGTDSAHPDTVQITLNSRRKSSEQARRHLLCACCEQRLNENGEKWVLHNCYRGRGRFRLREELRNRVALDSESDIEVYSASEAEAAKLAYFCLSVLWRASLCDWPRRGQTYHAIDLGPYQEAIRRYLRGETGTPQHVAVTLILSQLNIPVLAFSFPVSYRVDECHCHKFHIPGMSFVAAAGKEVPHSWVEICILRSPHRPIFVSKAGDERAQDEIMRLMGKVAPPWGKYPLVEGTERS
jgi:hypothetical protein